ncbi:MAG TPA: hypothetical protein VLR27_04415 [Acidimicrobiales bacterium]|nr:hypothetical protein [Acidimicrobiales bacterium]
MSKILTLTATGLAGLVLGAGIGVAAAGQDATPVAPERSAVTSMDEMHAAMVDQMPAELAEQCDEMHAAMSGHMVGQMGDMPGSHRDHHPDTEG